MVVLRTYGCDGDFDSINKKQEYLYMDYTISCLSPTYDFWLSYATLMVLVYPIGIPTM